MKKHVTTTSDARQNSVLWGEFRFAVVSHLVISHIDQGQIDSEIQQLSDRTWKHPISGEDVRFGFSTVERWYYRAVNAGSNPIAAPSSSRSDAGSHRALPNDGYAYLHSQFRTHRQSDYQQLYNKLDEFAKKRCWESLPHYSTVRRYLLSMARSSEREATDKIDKVERLVGHLRRCLITQSVRVHLLQTADGRTNVGVPQRYYRIPGPSEKLYVLNRLRDYKRAGGTMTAYCQSIGVSMPTVQRLVSAYAKGGLSGLVSHKRRKFPNRTKAKQTTTRILEIFHNQPRNYGINRTSWSGNSLVEREKRSGR